MFKKKRFSYNKKRKQPILRTYGISPREAYFYDPDRLCVRFREIHCRAFVVLHYMGPFYCYILSEILKNARVGSGGRKYRAPLFQTARVLALRIQIGVIALNL